MDPLNSYNLGAKTFPITKDEYLNLGPVMDLKMANDQEMQQTGVIVATVRHLNLQHPHDRLVQNIKQAFMTESERPYWQHVEPFKGANVFRLFTHKCKDDAVQSIREQVNTSEFPDNPDTELFNAYRSKGMNHCLDRFVMQLRNEGICTWYSALTPDTPVTQNPINFHQIEQNWGTEEFFGIPKDVYTFYGNEYSSFPMQYEAQSLPCINQHICGAPRMWFCIPPNYRDAVQNYLNENVRSKYNAKCTTSLLHSEFWLDPRLLMELKIPVTSVLQRPGDIVMLAPDTTHWGFSFGANLTESIYLPCKSWVIPALITHRHCLCQPSKNIKPIMKVMRDIFKHFGATDDLIAANVQKKKLPLLHKLPLYSRTDIGAMLVSDPNKTRFLGQSDFEEWGPMSTIVQSEVVDVSDDSDHETMEVVEPINEPTPQTVAIEKFVPLHEIVRYACPVCNRMITGQRPCKVETHIRMKHPQYYPEAYQMYVDKIKKVVQLCPKCKAKSSKRCRHIKKD